MLFKSQKEIYSEEKSLLHTKRKEPAYTPADKEVVSDRSEPMATYCDRSLAKRMQPLISALSLMTVPEINYTVSPKNM